jgi:hypothetical protein
VQDKGLFVKGYGNWQYTRTRHFQLPNLLTATSKTPKTKMQETYFYVFR